MYLAYVDDSGSTGHQLDDQQARFQVLGGPIIHDSDYTTLELMLSYELETVVPEDQWESFEFHTYDLFNANNQFSALGADNCRNLLKAVLTEIRANNMCVVFGAVDKVELKTQLYSSADPADMAFRLYLKSLALCLEDKFKEKVRAETGKSELSPDDLVTRMAECCIMIVDDSNKRVRRVIENAFRENRKRVRVFKDEAGPLWPYLMDDLYFGDSKYSLGIQLADVCAYFVARYLAKKPDAEEFYNIIRDQVHLQVAP